MDAKYGYDHVTQSVTIKSTMASTHPDSFFAGGWKCGDGCGCVELWCGCAEFQQINITLL